MQTNLAISWEFLGSDWITAIDVLSEKYVVAGSRDGRLYVLNRYGGVIFEQQYESWIGTAKIFTVGNPPRVLLFFGSKQGYMRLAELREVRLGNVDLSPIYEFKAANTLRQVDVLLSAAGVSESWVAAGSEDRHVYIINLREMLERPESTQPTAANPNGWIRAVAFCGSAAGQEPLIAAGCGDKHLYFYNTNGRERARVFVDSKIHGILSDQRTAVVFCCSDAKKLFIVGPDAESEYRIIAEHNLPHRATHLCFADRECKILLLACEDMHLYAFDTGLSEMIGSIPVGARVTSMREAGWGHRRSVLLGLAQKTLAFVDLYTRDAVVAPTGSRVKCLYTDPPSASLTGLSEVFLAGPKRVRWEVGIGRFIHITAAHAGAPSLAIVGSDEGDVSILEISAREARGELLHVIDGKREYRVWAVYGFWTTPEDLEIQIATSRAEIIVCTLQVSDGKFRELRREIIKLKDWPREIRPVSGRVARDRTEIVVACENGDLLILPSRSVERNLGETLRTAFAVKLEDGYEFLAGSDDASIRFIGRDGTEWRQGASDRIREVVIDNNLCIAVSEDRFLYVLEKTGHLIWRFRLPHRALCVDILRRDAAEDLLVIGCGDGFVYFLHPSGFIEDAFEFPDRIRDVRLLSQWSLVVACEDRYLYLAETVKHFVGEILGVGEVAFVHDAVKSLERKVRDEGPSVLRELASPERLFLLSYLPRWFDLGNADLAVALIDSLLMEVVDLGNLKAIYSFSYALVWMTMRIDFASGRSRIERFLMEHKDNSYCQHAFLATLAYDACHRGQVMNGVMPGRVVIDVIVRALDLGDDWVMEECASKLLGAGFFELGSEGFIRYFELFPIRFRRLERILGGARLHPRTKATPVIRLLDFLERGRDSADNVEQLILDCGLEGAGDNDVKRKLDDFVAIRALSHLDFTNRLEAWISSEIGGSVIRDYLRRLLNERFRGVDALGSVEIVIELVRETLLREDWEISARDYLNFRFFESFFRVRAAKSEGIRLT